LRFENKQIVSNLFIPELKQITNQAVTKKEYC
jgi:hypothetical protein